MRSLFSAHPASVGETYLQHLRSAFGFGGRMVVGGVACLIHGLLPFLFTSAGSRTIALLHEQMTERSRKAAGPPDRVNRTAGQDGGATSSSASIN